MNIQALSTSPALAHFHAAHKERVRRLFTPPRAPKPVPEKAKPDKARPLASSFDIPHTCLWLPSAGHIPRLRPARAIAAEIARMHGLTLDNLRGPCREKAFILARRDAIGAIASQRPDLSLPAIGKIMNKDHTTILHALRMLGMRKSRKDQNVATLSEPAPAGAESEAA